MLIMKKEKKEENEIMVIDTMVEMTLDIETREIFMKEMNQK
jgi:hypothetical protein